MSSRPLKPDKELIGPTLEAYKAFRWEHYQTALHEAHKLAEAWTDKDEFYLAVMPVLLDKLAKPEVYLRTQFDLLPLEVKVRYNPELEQIIAEARGDDKKVPQGRQT